MSREIIFAPGTELGRLTILKAVYVWSESERKCRKKYKCQCQCGGISIVLATDLKKGTKSCGCLQQDVARALQTRHGGKHGHRAEYNAWCNMKTRCFNDREAANRRNYSGRGITVCAEWVNDFAAFFAHIGPRPSKLHSVDRINNDKGYEPGNVRWAIKKVQANNRRTNRLLTIDGSTKTVAEWSDVAQIGQTLIASRLNRGWDAKSAVFGRPGAR